MNHFQKSNKKLEKLRGLFFQMGLIAACGLTFLAFEWRTTYSIVIPENDTEIDDSEYEIQPLAPEILVEQEEIKVERPPVKIDPTQFTPVDNEIKLTDEPKVNVQPISKLVPPWEPSIEPLPIEPPAPFTIVEKMPEFVGGEKGLFKYLGDNVNYPRVDIEEEREGIVYVRFVVGKQGDIEDIEITRGVSSTLDREALRVVRSMPKWKPGKQRGKKVRVIYNLPIRFKLK